MGDRWHHNAGHMMSFFEKKKNAQKRCCFNCNIWPEINWFTSHQSHYCLYYNSIPEFVRKRLMLTEKYLKQREIFEISLSESRIYKKWQTSAIIREISDSNLEKGRNGLNSGVSRIIWESWQPCGEDTYCWKSHHELLFHSLLIQSSFLHLMPPRKKWKLN